MEQNQRDFTQSQKSVQSASNIQQFIENLKKDAYQEIQNTIQSHKDKIFQSQLQNLDNSFKQKSPTKIEINKEQNLNTQQQTQTTQQQTRTLKDMSFQEDYRKFIQLKKQSYLPKEDNTYKPITLKGEMAKNFQFNEEQYQLSPRVQKIDEYAFNNINEMEATYSNAFKGTKYEIAQGIKGLSQTRQLQLNTLKDIFQFISNDQETISIDQIKDYLETNDYLQFQYNLDLDKIDVEINKQFGSSNITEQQFIKYFLLERQALKPREKINKRNVEQQTIISKEIIEFLQQIYKQVDIFGQDICSLQKIVEKIGNSDFYLKNQLQKVIYINSLSRDLTFYDCFYQLEVYSQQHPDYEICYDEYLKKFQIWQKLDICTIEKYVYNKRVLGKINRDEIINIPQAFIVLVKQIFNKQQIYLNSFVKFDDFIVDLKCDENYNCYLDQYVRDQVNINDEIEFQLKQFSSSYLMLDEIIRMFMTKRYLKDRQTKQFKNFENDNKENQVEFDGVQNIVKRKQERFSNKEQKNIDQYLNDNLKGTKMPYTLLKPFNTNAQITTPNEFNISQGFKDTIRQKKLQIDIQDKERQEQLLIQGAFRFKANEIPKTTTMPLYSKMLQKQDKRRKRVKERSQYMTKQSERPFSFYQRDFEKHLQRKTISQPIFKVKKFQAKEAPWYTQVHQFQKFNEEREKVSQQNKYNRKLELLSYDKYPVGVKNMLQRYETEMKNKSKKHKKLQKKHYPKSNKYKAKKTPNFQILQQDFAEKLAEKKEQIKQELEKKKAIVKEFKFRESKKQTSYRPEEIKLPSNKQRFDRINQISLDLLKIKNSIPRWKVAHRTTAKYEQQMLKKSQQLMQEQQEQQLELQQKRDKMYRRRQFVKFVNDSEAIKHSDQMKMYNLIERDRFRKTQAKEWDRQFDNMMINMMKRVIKRPLLVEEQSEGDFTKDRQRRLKMLLQDEYNDELDQVPYGFPGPEQFESEEQYQQALMEYNQAQQQQKYQQKKNKQAQNEIEQQQADTNKLEEVPEQFYEEDDSQELLQQKLQKKDEENQQIINQEQQQDQQEQQEIQQQDQFSQDIIQKTEEHQEYNQNEPIENQLNLQNEEQALEDMDEEEKQYLEHLQMMADKYTDGDIEKYQELYEIHLQLKADQYTDGNVDALVEAMNEHPELADEVNNLELLINQIEEQQLQEGQEGQDRQDDDEGPINEEELKEGIPNLQQGLPHQQEQHKDKDEEDQVQIQNQEDIEQEQFQDEEEELENQRIKMEREREVQELKEYSKKLKEQQQKDNNNNNREKQKKQQVQELSPEEQMAQLQDMIPPQLLEQCQMWEEMLENQELFNQEVEEQFQQYDMNQDGFVDEQDILLRIAEEQNIPIEEVEEFYHQEQELINEQIEDLLKHDRDDDGKLNFEEFKEYFRNEIQKNLAQVAEELNQMQQQMGEEGGQGEQFYDEQQPKQNLSF